MAARIEESPVTRTTLLIALPDPRLRERVAHGLSREPDLQVLATTGDLMNTYNEVEARQPSAVLIARSMASQPEFEVMRALFGTLDIRWLVVADGTPDQDAARRGSDLFAISATDAPHRLADRIREVTRRTRQSAPALNTAAPAPRPAASGRLILIGSSTGGVDALLTVLSSFPADCPPTLIVQHTGGGFGKSLVRLLDRQCAARVELATHGAPVSDGLVLVAAGTKAHLTVSAGASLRAELHPGAPISGHMPSVDALFQSAAPHAPRVAAAILTGMGRDGATGLKALRDAGASTIAQDEATSVVFGMPRAAIELGAAQNCLPLQSIGPALLKASRTAPAAAQRGIA